MTTILALDSAIGISSVAVWHEGKVVSYLENRESSMQSARLMPLVEEALAQAKLGYSDLTHIACTTGPGSFTGIRIGMAAARGIAFAANIPSLGFTTLRVMAEAMGSADCVAILNAGKGEVYYQYFGKNACAPTIGTLQHALSHPNNAIASSVLLPETYSQATITFPRADALAKLAALHPEEAADLMPFYIRPPDAKPQISNNII